MEIKERTSDSHRAGHLRKLFHRLLTLDDLIDV